MSSSRRFIYHMRTTPTHRHSERSSRIVIVLSRKFALKCSPHLRSFEELADCLIELKLSPADPIDVLFNFYLFLCIFIICICARCVLADGSEYFSGKIKQSRSLLLDSAQCIASKANVFEARVIYVSLANIMLRNILDHNHSTQEASQASFIEHFSNTPHRRRPEASIPASTCDSVIQHIPQCFAPHLSNVAI